MVTPANELQSRIEEKTEEKVDSLDSALDSELSSAADNDSWPVKYNLSDYDSDTRRRLEARASRAGYSTGWDGDYLVVHKPE